jgi:hypothetical protein
MVGAHRGAFGSPIKPVKRPGHDDPNHPKSEHQNGREPQLHEDDSFIETLPPQ